VSSDKTHGNAHHAPDRGLSELRPGLLRHLLPQHPLLHALVWQLFDSLNLLVPIPGGIESVGRGSASVKVGELGAQKFRDARRGRRRGEEGVRGLALRDRDRGQRLERGRGVGKRSKLRQALGELRRERVEQVDERMGGTRSRAVGRWSRSRVKVVDIRFRHVPPAGRAYEGDRLSLEQGYLKVELVTELAEVRWRWVE
jgi:hypothetical protein